MIGVLAAGIFIISLVTRRVVAPILVLEKAVSSNDLSAEISVESKDEVGRLAHGFRGMLHNLRGLLVTSEEATDSMYDSASQLGDITEQLVNGAYQVKQKMGEVYGILEAQSEQVDDSHAKLQGMQMEIEKFQEHFRTMNSIVTTANEELRSRTDTFKEK